MNGHNLGDTERAAEQLDPSELGSGIEWFCGYVTKAGSGDNEDSLNVLVAR